MSVSAAIVLRPASPGCGSADNSFTITSTAPGGLSTQFSTSGAVSADTGGHYCRPSAAYAVQQATGYLVTVYARGHDNVVVQGYDVNGNSTGTARAKLNHLGVRVALSADPGITNSVVLFISGTVAGSCVLKVIEPASPSRQKSRASKRPKSTRCLFRDKMLIQSADRTSSTDQANPGFGYSCRQRNWCGWAGARGPASVMA